MFDRSARVVLLAAFTTASLASGVQTAYADAQPTNVSPSTSANDDPEAGTKVLNITGSGFTGTPAVALVKTGLAPIPGSNVNVLPGTSF